MAWAGDELVTNLHSIAANLRRYKIQEEEQGTDISHHIAAGP